MSEISLCIIVKDEEKVIERCLDSVKKVVDEIIIVDTGSRDSTKDKLKKYNIKLYDYNWNEDFAAARNYAFSKASKDYIFWMDADDVLMENSIEKFLKLKDSLNEYIDFVTMDYVLSIDENNNPQYVLKRNRLVKRKNNYKWIGKIHEYLNVSGKSIISDISIMHLKEKEYTNRNLLIYEKMKIQGEKFSTRDIYYFANELRENKLYLQAIEEYKKFINSSKAWIEDIKNACERLYECYYLLGDKESAIESLLISLKHDKPNANISCKLGEYFIEKDNINAAIYWYEEAKNYKNNENNTSIMNNANNTWVPALQLCICYYKIGEYDKAYKCNEEASKYVPNNGSVIYNRSFFKSIGIGK